MARKRMSGEDVLKLLDNSDDSDSESDLSSDESDKDTVISDENETDSDNSETQSSQPVVQPAAASVNMAAVMWSYSNFHTVYWRAEVAFQLYKLCTRGLFQIILL